MGVVGWEQSWVEGSHWCSFQPAARGLVVVSLLPPVPSKLLGWLSLKSIRIPAVVSEQHLIQRWRWACQHLDASGSPAVGAKARISFRAGKRATHVAHARDQHLLPSYSKAIQTVISFPGLFVLLYSLPSMHYPAKTLGWRGETNFYLKKKKNKATPKPLRLFVFI